MTGLYRAFALLGMCAALHGCLTTSASSGPTFHGKLKAIHKYVGSTGDDLYRELETESEDYDREQAADLKGRIGALIQGYDELYEEFCETDGAPMQDCHDIYVIKTGLSDNVAVLDSEHPGLP